MGTTSSEYRFLDRMMKGQLRTCLEADDVCQDAWLSYFRSDRSRLNRGAIRTDLLRQTRWRLKDELRARSRRESPYLEIQAITETAAGPQEATQKREIWEVVRGELHALDYEIIHRRFRLNYSIREVAAHLDLSEDCVETRLRRLLKKLLHNSRVQSLRHTG